MNSREMMKKPMKLAALAAIVLGAATFSSCATDCMPPPPRDPDDVTGRYEVNYRLYFNDIPEAGVEGVADVYVGPGMNTMGEEFDLMVTFSPRGGVPEGSETVSWLESGLVELKGVPGNYSIAGQSEDAVLGLSKSGKYSLLYYDADVSVAGTIVTKAVNTRCSPVFQEPDMYHDIELTIVASVNVALDGAEPQMRNMRLDVSSR